jgi:hypothetical protein
MQQYRMFFIVIRDVAMRVFVSQCYLSFGQFSTY